MGNRDDLLDAAKHLIATKGYARTSARDIATEAGVSLASIGYHFDSTQALLNSALIEVMEEFGDRNGGESPQTADDPGQRFARYWKALADGVRDDRRVWIANFEALVEIDRVSGLREQLALAMDRGRQGTAAVLDAAATAEAERGLSLVMGAITTGLIVQWLVDPENAAHPGDVARGIREIARQLESAAPTSLGA